MIDDELERCAAAASRFDPFSELSTLNTDGQTTTMSDDFVDYLRAAILGVHLSGGLVDPAVGGALIALGYDRDFSQIDAGSGSEQPPVHTWANDVVIDLDRRTIALHNGARLDLGATSKAHCADRIAQRLVREDLATGACVSLGGDVATAGVAPAPGWSIAIVESARERTLLSTNDTISDAEDLMVIEGGGVATSSSIGRVAPQRCDHPPPRRSSNGPLSGNTMGVGERARCELPRGKHRGNCRPPRGNGCARAPRSARTRCSPP